MSNLPISVNSNSKPPVPQSNAGNAEQQGTQEFGNVLAQQMAGSEHTEPAAGKPERSAKNAAQPANDDLRDAAANMAGAETPSLVSAEMLASLLGQAGAGTQDSSDALQNMSEDDRMPRKTASADKLMQNMLPGGSADTLTSGKSGSGQSVMPDALSGIQAASRPGSFQEMMQGVQTAGKAGAALELLSDKAAANRNPAELMQLAQPGTAPGELTTTTLHTLQPSSSNPLPASAQIAAPLHHPSWPDEFGQKVSWIATQQNQTAELHLNPPQLGPLDITLKMTGDQANASFSSPHAAVREAIEQALPRLREILADSGITLGQATVSDQSARQHRDEAAQARNKRLSSDGIVESSQSLSAASLPPVRRHHGMVDTFV